MLSPASIQDIKDKVNRNDEKITILQSINTILKERHEIENNFKNLSIKYTKLQKEETERRDKYDQTRKQVMKELEFKGADLCKEHSKVLHQIEHITWHLDGCARHSRPCLGRLPENCTKKDSATNSCISTDTNFSLNRPSHMANLKNTAERLIKNIVDLRKKIYIVQDKLEHEIKRKRDMEKKLSELRRDISRQKKLLTVRRTTPTLSMSSSLPPIKKSFGGKHHRSNSESGNLDLNLACLHQHQHRPRILTRSTTND